NSPPMPDLYHTLHKYDLGHLRIIAGLWGLELESNEADSAAEELASALLDPEPVRETMDILAADARAALKSLVESNGKVEWGSFARKFGEVREMGEGKRDRERPHLKPISPAETLFYYGFLAKAFFDSDKGAQEFAYVPDDLLELMKLEGYEEKKQEPLGRPATPIEKAFEIPASDHILDDATTYLAALRVGRSDWQSDLQLTALLTSAGLLKKNAPQAEKVKSFLEASRADALKLLMEAWQSSQTFDELRLIPNLICEGEWLRQNQPQVTREFLMDLVNSVPQDKWWSMPAFVRAIKEKFPDFQRPAGDYDSWFIKRESDGQYLRGFAYWDQVDGALIKHLIHTLHWLGMADLASAEDGKDATAFRVIGAKVEGQKSDLRPSTFDGKISISSNGKITIPRTFSRAARYQVSRFCEWGEDKPDEFHYQVTARSLSHAKEQGLQAAQLLALLVKYTNGAVPPALVKALKQWETHGTEARVRNLLVLRVTKPEIVEELRKSKAGKFLGEILSPTAVTIKSGAESKVLAALAELGLLAEIET
ncbi:MAG: helicase-associated domain-containing protein, partial [Anaerolineales bacterium]|nr:helicase-associated domain-containing protein [Anaerolineales bacterium]